MEPTVDPSMLPLPAALQPGGGASGSNANSDHPVEFLSVIFNQRESNQVLRISGQAITPMWLKKNMYKKLNTSVTFELEPIDTEHLSRRYVAFEQKLNDRNTATPEEASALDQLKRKAQ